MDNPKFRLGQLLATPAALKTIEESNQTPFDFLARHNNGDWGTVCPGDWRLNDEAIKDGTRIVSAYLTKKATKIWIITEADRSATTILLPEEY